MRLTVERQGVTAIVVLESENLDAGNVQEFKRQIAPVLATEQKAVFDLGQVQFIDSPGLGQLLSCLRQLNAKGGSLTLCAPSKPVRSLLELVNMHHVFDIANTREEALVMLNS